LDIGRIEPDPPSGLNITYVEIAAHMMALSQKRNTGSYNVTFINDAVENVALPTNLMSLLPRFCFDNFTEQTLKRCLPI